MNVDLKKSKESSRYASSWKFINESEQGEFELEGCKVHQVLTISEKVEARAMGVRTLVVCVNSFAPPRAKLCPSQQAWGRMGVGSREGMVTIGARFVGSVAISTYALRRCSAWSSSQLLKRNHWKPILVSRCLTNPPLRGRGRYHCGNKRDKCQATLSNGSQVKQLKGRQKINYTFHYKAKRMHKNKQGWRRSTWKALKG